MAVYEDRSFSQYTLYHASRHILVSAVRALELFELQLLQFSSNFELQLEYILTEYKAYYRVVQKNRTKLMTP